MLYGPSTLTFTLDNGFSSDAISIAPGARSPSSFPTRRVPRRT